MASGAQNGDRHDVRYTDQERSTRNVQLSTFNGVTERAHAGPNMGTDTEFGRPDFGLVDLSKRRSGGPGRSGAQIWGQTRCPICRSGTFNVQRSTLNVQWGDRKGAWWAGYGDRHGIWATGLLTRWTCPSAGRALEAGSELRYGDRHGIWRTGLLTRRTCPSAGRVVPAGCGAQIWGQTRCPIYRLGTFNVKRSTLNF